ITTTDDDTSNRLKTDVSSTMTDLKTKKGADFDKAYIDSQVKMHSEALDLVDNELIPSAKNPELKDHLNGVRAHVADHLAKAQEIQTKLQAVGSTGTAPGSSKAKTPAPKGTEQTPKTPSDPSMQNMPAKPPSDPSGPTN